MTSYSNLVYIIPEITLGVMACVLFLLSPFLTKNNAYAKYIYPIITLLAIVAAFASLKGIYDNIHAVNITGIPIFYSLLSIDPFSILAKGLILLITGAGVLLTLKTTSHNEVEKSEYYGLLLTLAMGMLFLCSANSLMMIYISIECVSLCSYLLAGFDQKNDESREAGLKYVLYGGVASGIMLFGMSLLYGITGSLALPALHSAIYQGWIGGGAGLWALLISTTLIIVGLGFKISAVPFHSWCPDVYQGAPTAFTAILSTAPKAAAFTVIIRFFYHLFSVDGTLPEITVSSQIPWVVLLGIISVLSMTLGNLSAIQQTSVKRLLAYSSIAHAGYMLMGVVAGDKLGFQAVMINLIIYAIMNVGAFAVVSMVEDRTGSDDIHSFKGLSSRAPWLSILMAVFLFSLAGIPPTAGFVGKLYLFVALLRKGHPGYTVLAIIAVINSVVAFYYYARVLRAMYLEKSDSAQQPETTSEIHPSIVIATVLAFCTIYLGIFWQNFATITEWSAKILR